MPLPLIAALAGGAALVGIGKCAIAAKDQWNAFDTNRDAQRIGDKSTENVTFSREACYTAIENLGRKKMWIQNNTVKSFIQTFEQIHNVELSDSVGMDELRQFQIDELGFADLKKLTGVTESLADGIAGGATAGALTALAVFGGASVCTAVEVGGFSGLSAIVAADLTLDFLAGIAIDIGLESAAVILGGLALGPALAVTGFIVGAKASENLDKANANLAQTERFEEEINIIRVRCRGIRMRTNLFERLLIKLDELFQPMIDSLNHVIETSGTDYRTFSDEEKKIVAGNLALAQAVKAVLDTPILTEDGALTEESEKIVEPVGKVIAEYAGA